MQPHFLSMRLARNSEPCTKPNTYRAMFQKSRKTIEFLNITPNNTHKRIESPLHEILEDECSYARRPMDLLFYELKWLRAEPRLPWRLYLFCSKDTAALSVNQVNSPSCSTAISTGSGAEGALRQANLVRPAAC
uniref:Uncharacterized protein n=1 Tax=Zea mays TaxID=4577 RepID=C0PA98_MAIZE|nr:unknown [Zea mays]